jgi:ankyrin repeat protein
MVLDLLRVSGADMGIINGNGETPLMTACREGHHACVTVLVKADCNVDAVGDVSGNTALMYAIHSGQP